MEWNNLNAAKRALSQAIEAKDAQAASQAIEYLAGVEGGLGMEAFAVEAAGAGWIQGLEMLAEAGASLEMRNGADHSALNRSILQEQWAAMDWLLARGANPNSVDRGKLSSLMMASGRGVARAVAALVEAGANPNAVNADGVSALMFAARNAGPEIIRLLLSLGADPDARDKRGRAALFVAAEHGQEANVAQLLAGNADPETVDAWKISPAQIARENCKGHNIAQMIEAAIEAKALRAASAASKAGAPKRM